MKLFARGIGGSTGDPLATAGQYQTMGDVWYVYNATGTDGAGLGRQRTAPLKTLAQAITNSADGDDIVFLAGHAETLTAVQTIAKRVRLVGEGTFGTTSMPQFTRNAAGSSFNLFNITVSRVQLRNLRFPATIGAAAANAKVLSSGTDLRVRGCYFEAGQYDTGAQLSTSVDRLRVDSGTTFVSTSTGPTTAPSQAILSSINTVDIALLDVVVDGGVSGWSSAFAVDFPGGHVNIQIENLSLLRDSDMEILTSTTSFVSLGTCSGSARVVHA